MKTEENHINQLKKERRKVFWRLYSLPWLICVMVLLGAIGGLIWAYTGFQRHNITLLTEIREQEYIRAEKITSKRFYLEAVCEGFGYWEISNDGQTTFKWKTSTPTNIPLPIVRSLNVEKDIKRDVTLSSSILSEMKDIGYDIEKILLKDISIILDAKIYGKENKLLRESILSQIEMSIGQRIEGLKTYQQIKLER